MVSLSGLRSLQPQPSQVNLEAKATKTIVSNSPEFVLFPTSV